MAKYIWKLARLLAGVGFLIIGARNVPEPSSTIEQRWREVIPWAWLQANWIALACFVLATVLFLYQPLKWWIDRHNARDIRNRIRANLIPGTFHETDASEVVRFLLRESVWGWRQYARLNFWMMVEGLELGEFKRRARDGAILTIGFGSRENAVVPIDRRQWIDGRIEERTARVPNAVVMEIRTPSGFRHTYSQLAVATADYKLVWPKASAPYRLWCRSWVLLKIKFWYGSALNNWLDERRRRAREAKRED